MQQGGDERDCLPRSKRNGADHPYATWSSSPQPCQICAAPHSLYRYSSQGPDGYLQKIDTRNFGVTSGSFVGKAESNETLRQRLLPTIFRLDEAAQPGLNEFLPRALSHNSDICSHDLIATIRIKGQARPFNH